MRESKIVDASGNPIRVAELTREIAAPSLSGVRNLWNAGTVASGLSPERLATVLRNAAEGDHHEYLTLAEEMEEREPHYMSVLGTRKRAITGIEATVEAASDDALDQKLADAVRELIRAPAFDDMRDDAVDAIGKGYSVNEIMWDRSGKEWQPSEYRFRDPRFFVFDQESRRQLHLLDETNNFTGIPLAPFKFITHIPKLKSGIPIRGGLARLVATPYMCKSYTLTDWMAFAEVFGMPLRLGRYGPSANQNDINKLITAVANIGTDAAAVLPDSMRIDFQEAGKASGGQDLFLKLAEWLDRQTSKAVLGQTASSEGTPGRLGSDDAQDDVRKDILRADCKQLASTLNRDLIKPYIDLNFGVQENYPRILLQVIEPEDTTALADVLAKLVPLGLRIQASEVRDRIGFADPDEGAEVLGGPATPPATATGAAPNHACTCHHGSTGSPQTDKGRALNRQTPAGPDIIDELAADGLADWQEQMTPITDPLQQLADQAQSYEEFLAGLPGLLQQMDATDLVKRLAAQAFKARGAGDATDEV